MSAPVDPASSRSALPRLVTNLTLAVAAAALLVWVWSYVCAFPAIVWNDVRLAPTIALTQGWSVFPTSDTGTVNTWTYGPLPLLYYLPAALAPSAGGAMLTAAILNLALTILPVALVCFAWPAWQKENDTRKGRAIAFLLCMAVWPSRHYEVIFADNLAIACGLIGNLVLVRARSSRALWIAAFIATAAVACKQITLGIPLAQAVWLGLTQNWRAAGRHALRCVASGAVIAALLIPLFGGAGLWFVLMELPAQFPWNFDVRRVLPALPEATVQVLLPGLALIFARRAFAHPALLLPAVAWACALPLGLLALTKNGGWLNSLHGLVLWLPPVITMLFTARLPERLHRWLPLSAALAAAAIACGRVVSAPQLPLRPQVDHYHDAGRIAANLRGQVWFPFNPLVTLYSEQRYYHDEDGLYVRNVAKKPIPPAQAAAHLPAALRVMAFHTAWNDWGIAKSMLPPGSTALPSGEWALWSSRAPTPR